MRNSPPLLARNAIIFLETGEIFNNFPMKLSMICCYYIWKLAPKYDICFFLRNNSEYWNGFGDSHVSGLALAQDVVAFFIMLCFGRLLCFPIYLYICLFVNCLFLCWFVWQLAKASCVILFAPSILPQESASIITIVVFS